MNSAENLYVKAAYDYEHGRNPFFLNKELHTTLIAEINVINLYGQKYEDEICDFVDNGKIVKTQKNSGWLSNLYKDMQRIVQHMLQIKTIQLMHDDILVLMKAVTTKKLNKDSTGQKIYKTVFKKQNCEYLLAKLCNRLILRIEQEKNAEVQSNVEKKNERNVLSEEIMNRQNNRNFGTMLDDSCIKEFLGKYKCEVDKEMRYLQSNGGKKYRIFDGQKILKSQEQYIYTFESDNELHFPDGTEINIYRTMDANVISGTVIGCVEFTIILSSDEDLGEFVTTIEISAEPWRLLSRLYQHLEEDMICSSEIARALICDGKKHIDYSKREIITGQDNAIKMAKKQPITFVWGPPGTGKTQTLARIALEHMKLGHKVLMVSYSNVSVDGAILRVHRLIDNLKPGELIRYGYARESTLLEHEYLTSYNLVIRNYPELLKQQNKLLEERQKTPRNTKRFLDINTKLKEIRRQLYEEERQTVKKAKFVATTVTKAIVDSIIYDDIYDVVIFDEASMAYLPQIVFSASIARKHFICLGDFCQLPPIVQNAKDSILNNDIFYHCGIVNAVHQGCNHGWLCMLDEQYRMHSSIADFSSRTMYQGLLKTANNVDVQRSCIVNSRPMERNAIAFADLSAMMSVCTKTSDESRINVLSAFISAAIAMQAGEKNEVGVITPYHAQSRLLHAMACDIMQACPELKPISCATVHQFQGSEKDIIVYDAVDCYRMAKPGMLLTSTNNDYANRLFNVALTRAKGKFIGVANVGYMNNKLLSNRLIFKHLIDLQKGHTGYKAGDKLLAELKQTNNEIMTWCDNASALELLLADIGRAKNIICMDIPDQPADNENVKQIAAALASAEQRGVKVIIRAESKRSLPDYLQFFARENPYVMSPVTIIDRKYIWFGMPYSNAYFKLEGRNLPIRYRPIFRFVGTKTAIALYGLLEMGKIEDKRKELTKDANGILRIDNFSEYVLANKKCPKCGKPLKLMKAKQGRFFLGCTGYPTCKYSELVTVELVEEYFYHENKKGMFCKRCGYSLTAKLGRNGVYVICGDDPPHTFSLDEI